MDKEELMQHFYYDPETGVFSRKSRKNSHGSVDVYGYLILKIKGKQYKAHRMAWLYVHGELPNGCIDHINRDKLDNRIVNLRCVSQAENTRNSTIKTNINTGYKGVHIDRTVGTKKRFATKVKGKTYRFYSALEAHKFRLEKLKEEYGDGHF
jgi:YHS domain-containing protein